MVMGCHPTVSIHNNILSKVIHSSSSLWWVSLIHSSRWWASLWWVSHILSSRWWANNILSSLWWVNLWWVNHILSSRWCSHTRSSLWCTSSPGPPCPCSSQWCINSPWWSSLGTMANRWWGTRRLSWSLENTEKWRSQRSINTRGTNLKSSRWRSSSEQSARSRQ